MVQNPNNNANTLTVETTPFDNAEMLTVATTTFKNTEMLTVEIATYNNDTNVLPIETTTTTQPCKVHIQRHVTWGIRHVVIRIDH